MGREGFGRHRGAYVWSAVVAIVAALTYTWLAASEIIPHPRLAAIGGPEPTYSGVGASCALVALGYAAAVFYLFRPRHPIVLIVVAAVVSGAVTALIAAVQ
jgi:hypothetical protein